MKNKQSSSVEKENNNESNNKNKENSEENKSDEYKKIILEIRKQALKNAYFHNGKANPNAVLGAILSIDNQLKKNIDEIKQKINKICKDINNISLEEQEKEINEKYPELLKKEKKTKDLPELPNAEVGKVITRIPPEPSKYVHIGHGLSFLINYLYAKKYNGKVILRFEDTNPEKSSQEFVNEMLDDITNYLDIKPDQIVFASDDMNKFYEHAKILIKNKKAYVCSCSKDKISELRKKGQACDCRENTLEKNLEEWKNMAEGKYNEGEKTLRLKIDMKHKNYAMRDPVIFRINKHKHYKQGNKYSAWPVYDFENSLEDSFCKITHILRSNEFGKMREELQNYIKDLFNYPKQTVIQYGRFNVTGTVTQGREIREKIESGEFQGWDYPRLVTLKALKRRGIQKGSLYELVKQVGLSPTQTNINWEVIARFNRKFVDKKAERYFLIKNPVEIKINNVKEQELKLKLHPDKDDKFKSLKISDEFLIEKEDYNTLKEGEVYRLMECINFYKKGDSFYYHSTEYNDAKDKIEKIIHWLPNIKEEITEIKIMMPDATKIKALCEKNIKTVKIDQIVQFERFGFARKDSETEFWYSHK